METVKQARWRWRWRDEKGFPMTNWSDKDPPPPHMRAVSDFRGTMFVEFENEKADHNADHSQGNVGASSGIEMPENPAEC